jgi:DNA-binding NtrC family response regulator
MIAGETGTGKELVARAIHSLSARSSQPFISVNCGALPESLLESELFGHERGAFTDAREARPGLVAQAGSGTLFFDEVDALTPRAQVAVLRLLENRTFRALGSRQEETSDARFLSATNASLRHLVETGAFRADLYYRLCVLTISLPPLRDRADDIPLLTSHFLAKHSPSELTRPVLSATAQAALMSYSWPGNLRELENTIRRALLINPTGPIDTQDLELPLAPRAYEIHAEKRGTLGFRVLKDRAIETFEREYLTNLMREHRGNISQAARAAGKERRDLGRLLKKHKIDCRVPSSDGSA